MSEYLSRVFEKTAEASSKLEQPIARPISNPLPLMANIDLTPGGVAIAARATDRRRTRQRLNPPLAALMMDGSSAMGAFTFP
jgi:hypothetical protein